MDVATITQLVTSVGFPIVMCLLLFKHTDDLNKEHKEEMSQVTQALNNNTLVLQKLCDKMGEE